MERGRQIKLTQKDKGKEGKKKRIKTEEINEKANSKMIHFKSTIR